MLSGVLCTALAKDSALDEKFAVNWVPDCVTDRNASAAARARVGVRHAVAARYIRLSWMETEAYMCSERVFLLHRLSRSKYRLRGCCLGASRVSTISRTAASGQQGLGKVGELSSSGMIQAAQRPSVACEDLIWSKDRGSYPLLGGLYSGAQLPPLTCAQQYRVTPLLAFSIPIRAFACIIAKERVESW